MWTSGKRACATIVLCVTGVWWIGILFNDHVDRIKANNATYVPPTDHYLPPRPPVPFFNASANRIKANNATYVPPTNHYLPPRPPVPFFNVSADRQKTDIADSVPQSIQSTQTEGKPTRFFIDDSYSNVLMQYNSAFPKVARAELEAIPKIDIKPKARPSQCSLHALEMAYQVMLHRDRLECTVTVRDTRGRPATGVSFFPTQVFTVGKEKRRTLCNSYDQLNGTYSIVCRHPRVSDCVVLGVNAVHCDFEAFKFVNARRRELVQARYCFPQPALSPLPQSAAVVSWSLDNRDKCQEVYFDNVRQTQLTGKPMCTCLAKFDRVYLMGSSHMGHFSDYVMHSCAGLDMTQLQNKSALRHGELQVGNIYYRDGRYIKDLYEKLQRELDSYLQNTTRVALCIQTGVWDLFVFGIDYGLQLAVEYLERLIVYVQTKIAASGSRVDLHLLSTPPRPSGQTLDRLTVAAFNRAVQLIAEKHGVSFINGFAILDPCFNDTPTLNRNHTHHFVEGRGNRWEGTVGFAFYRGMFLRALCPHVSAEE